VFSSEVGTGSREENTINKEPCFQAKWVPVRVKKTRLKKSCFQAKWAKPSVEVGEALSW
jgi:hypothetical protein